MTRNIDRIMVSSLAGIAIVTTLLCAACLGGWPVRDHDDDTGATKAGTETEDSTEADASATSGADTSTGTTG